MRFGPRCCQRSQSPPADCSIGERIHQRRPPRANRCGDGPFGEEIRPDGSWQMIMLPAEWMVRPPTAAAAAAGVKRRACCAPVARVAARMMDAGADGFAAHPRRRVCQESPKWASILALSRNSASALVVAAGADAQAAARLKALFFRLIAENLRHKLSCCRSRRLRRRLGLCI